MKETEKYEHIKIEATNFIERRKKRSFRKKIQRKVIPKEILDSKGFHPCQSPPPYRNWQTQTLLPRIREL